MKVASSSELGRLRATPAPRIKAGRLDDDNDDDDECGTQNRKDVRVFSMSFYLDFVIALQKPFVSLSLSLYYYSWKSNRAEHDRPIDSEQATGNKLYERLRERLSGKTNVTRRSRVLTKQENHAACSHKTLASELQRVGCHSTSRSRLILSPLHLSLCCS